MQSGLLVFPYILHQIPKFATVPRKGHTHTYPMYLLAETGMSGKGQET